MLDIIYLDLSDNQEKIVILFLAIVFDLLTSEPRVFHPVVCFGKLISYADKIYMRRNRYLDFITGFISSFIVILFALFLSLIPEFVPFWIGFGLSVFLTKTTFAIRSLEEHVRNTVVADIEVQREQTALIVSRDVSKLKRNELCSASIESLSENLVDSVISPIFYFILFGLPGAMIYRAVNTMDAVIGYRSEEYLYFGKFIARLDDILNFIPARISFLLFLPLSRRVFAYYRMARFKINGDKPIACMSAVLGVNLEKRGVYSFPGRTAELEDILRGIKIFRVVLTEWLFVTFAILLLEFYLRV
jgi:adenosylcobinamide-phosphate synthase